MNTLSPMARALELAHEAAAAGEVPVGAVIVNAATGRIIAEARNRTQETRDPTAHAELLAIRQACQAQGAARLENADLYVTLEPCPMCAAAISFARVRRLYFGAYDPKGGGVDHGPRIFEHATCHHRPEIVGGLAESEAGDLLKAFFKEKR